MQTIGTVKSFDTLRKYGFINLDTGGVAFVHQNDLQEVPNQVLMKRDRVAFDLMRDKRGLRAANVRLVD